jgi:diguanylate cyclase
MILRRSASSDRLMAVIDTQTEIVKLGLDLPGVMELVAERARHIVGASGAVVELAEGDDMVYRAVAGIASGMLGVRVKRSGSLSGLCVAAATALRCDDSESDPRVDRHACRKVGLRSMIVVPLIHDGAAVGVLKMLSATISAFDDGDIHVIGLMSELIAAAMFHAVRYGGDELFRQATRDSLTGLANRALFLDRFRHALARSKRAATRFAILMIDMDGLKPINDQYGHRAGDAALQQVAVRIAAETREADTAARLGGDEFAVLLSSVKDRAGALAAIDRIDERSREPFHYEDHALNLGVSAGMALYPDDGDELETLLEAADRHMYAVKRRKVATPRP